MTFTAVLTGVCTALGLFLSMGFIAMWGVVFRRRAEPSMALGCALLAVGVMLFSMMVMLGLPFAYWSRPSPQSWQRVSVLRPPPDRPMPTDKQPKRDRLDGHIQDDRAADGRTSNQSGGQTGRPESSVIPSPADQPPLVSQADPQPTGPGTQQQSGPPAPATSNPQANVNNSGAQKLPPAGEAGALAESGSTGKAQSKTPSDDVNAESADLLSRAMARGIKAALDFLAKEGALEKSNEQEHGSGDTSPTANQKATQTTQAGKRPEDKSAGVSTAGASGEATTVIKNGPGATTSDSPIKNGPVATASHSPENTQSATATNSAANTQSSENAQALPKANDELKPAAPRQRPAWVDTPLERTPDGHRLALKVGPCFSSDECRRSLPDELQKAVNQFAREHLQLDSADSIRLEPEVLQTTLVRDTWEETIETSVGPTVWLHVLVEFDRRAGVLIKEAYRQAVIERRLKSVGAILGCTLLLLGIAYVGLRTDERLAGRFRLLMVTMCLLVAGTASAGTVWLLRQLAHGS